MTTIHPPVPSAGMDDMEISPVQPTAEQSHPLSSCSSPSCGITPSAKPKRHSGPTKPLKWYHFSYPSSFLDILEDRKLRRQQKKIAASTKEHFKDFDQSPDSQTPDEKSPAPQTPERQSSVAFAPLPTRGNGYETPPVAGREKLKPLDMAAITSRAIKKSPDVSVNSISLSPLEQQMASETKSFAALGPVSKTPRVQVEVRKASILTDGPKIPEVPKMPSMTIYGPYAALGSVSKTPQVHVEEVRKASILTDGPKIPEVPKMQAKTIYEACAALGSISNTPRVVMRLRKAPTLTDGPKIPEVPKMQAIRKTPCDCEDCMQMSAIRASRCRRDLEEFFLLLERNKVIMSATTPQVHIFNPEGHPSAVPSYSHVSVVQLSSTSKLVSFAGQTYHPSDASASSNTTPLAEQVRLALANVDKCMAAAGCTKKNIVSNRQYVVRMMELSEQEFDDRENEFLKWWKSTEGDSLPPPDSLIGVHSLARKDILYECEVTCIVQT
ncbi:hypothetical protein LTR56_017536 [Elasticomyces elasticus]|nr:hypothetical protein LTR22_022396 [Elasticomyces elasticus]KAK3630248.1 hypothetical protein LTR56_017536 [Elasticomyces elasticus]KAK4913914.1 hypothetical protein LTR49_017840 [Elasticomyces elasticus]KAK5766375.1 hypothetical protein LTS12_003587 [Elasticomyces elasticus]